MIPSPMYDLIENKASSGLCYKTHLCYIYSKKKKSLHHCILLERYYCLPLKYLVHWHFICGSLVILEWGNFKFMLLKPLCLMDTQCYIMYPVYVTACKESAQHLSSPCKLYILSFVLCLTSIYLFDLKWQLPHVLLLWMFGLYAVTWQI